VGYSLAAFAAGCKKIILILIPVFFVIMLGAYNIAVDAKCFKFVILFGI
jgi:hypothetical protein